MTDEYKLAINFKEELEPYIDQFQNVRLRGDELISSSPFREDNSPSFSLNLETGLWIDFGSSSDIWGKGNFFKLMAFLTGEHYEDVIAHYKQYDITRLANIEDFKLNVDLEIEKAPKVFNMEDFDYWKYKSDYLTKRGITEKAQRAFRIGYDVNNKAVAIPYFNRQGQLVNVKFRKTSRKQFYYLPDGQPVGQYVYGLNMVKRAGATRVYVVESEIDAMYLWSYGIPAVALSKAYMSERQEELLDLSPVTELVLAFDNDKAGRQATRNVQKRMAGKYRLDQLILPQGCKDVNDINKNFIVSGELQTVSLDLSIELG